MICLNEAFEMTSRSTRLTPDPEDFYIPFAAATFAVGISQKRVRNWLDRDLIFLDANAGRGDAGKHRRFTELDSVRMGIVGRLTRYGFAPEWASKITEEIFFGCLEAAKFPSGYKASDPDKVLGALRSVAVTFWYDEDDEEDHYLLFTTRKREPKDVREHDARLTLDIGKMVEAMYDRLEAAGLLTEAEMAESRKKK
jgi:hypothetical protein